VSPVVKGKPVSPWHDVPLFASAGGGDLYNFIVEIPMYSTAKMEVMKVTYNIQHTTYNIQHTTYNIQHTTYNIQHITYNI
jgi:inorganic pyrophosphatase